MIRIQNLFKAYDERVAVAGIDLEIPSGSVFGLIGPNGAGKTTTLKMLATLIHPDEGTIEIDGQDVIRDVRSVRRQIGYMPDQFGLFRGLSCAEYLQFFGRSYDLDGDELDDRVRDVLELTDMGAVRDEVTTALSMGMRQRLSLAKTLLHDPGLLFLDEPASGLDPRARIEIRTLLKELGRMGKTIVISSHILADLEEICDQVGMIEHGRLVWSGPIGQEPVLEDGQTAQLSCRVECSEEHADRARAALEALEGVEVSVAGDRRFELVLEGRFGNRILEALLRADVEVLSFQLERPSLESLFLERTSGDIT